MKNKIVILLTAWLIACGGNTNPSTTARQQTDAYPVPKDKAVLDTSGVVGGKLVLSIPGNPDTFNANLSNSANAVDALAGTVYEALSDLDLSTFEERYLLAKSYAVSSDGLTYTYDLREGVLWSDGQPFTADDVLFTFQVVCDANIAADAREMLMQSDGTLPEIVKLSDYQVQFKLKEVNVLFNGAVGSVYIIPKHVWEESYKNQTFGQTMNLNEDPKKMVATGPFTIDSFDTDQRIVLKKNPYYYRFDKNGVRLPYYDKIIFTIVPDIQTRLIKFQNGEIDFYDTKPEDVDLLKRNEKTDGYTVYDLGPSFDTHYIVFNQNPNLGKNGKPYVEPKKLQLFSDKRFKQAISYAIDRESIIRNAFHGHGTPLYAFTSPANKIWYNPNQKKYPFDLAKAKSLLDEIGLKDGNGDGLLEYADGSPLRFTLVTNSENATRIQTGNMLKNDLRTLGIDAILQPIPFNSVSDKLNKNFDFDAVLLGWGSAVPPDPAISKSVIMSNGKAHNWNPAQSTPHTDWEKRMDELLYKNQSTLDLKERVRLWHEILDIWGEELPEIMTVTTTFHMAAYNHVGNFVAFALRPYHGDIAIMYDKRLEGK